eukprot:gene18649-26363_t
MSGIFNPFAKEGVKVRFLRFYISSCAGDNFLSQSIADVCEAYVKPSTKQYNQSYCDMMKQTNPEMV